MSINRSDEMTSTVGQEKPEAGYLSALRAVALIVLLVGAVGSVGLVLHAGWRKHSPRLLLALFAMWVLSPFVALGFANIASKGWSVIMRTTLYSVMLVLTLCSLAIYGYVALGPLGAKTVPVFVIVPPASWLLITIVVSIAALISGRLSRRSGRPS
jgi:hypothetical protein